MPATWPQILGLTALFVAELLKEKLQRIRVYHQQSQKYQYIKVLLPGLLLLKLDRLINWL